MHANSHAHARTNTRTNAKTHACTNTNQLKNIVIHLITIITLIDPRYWSFSLSFSVHKNSVMHANNSIMHGKSPSWIIDYLEQNGHFSKHKKKTFLSLSYWKKLFKFIKRHILSSFFLIRSFFLLWFYFWWNWVVSKHFCNCRYPF